MINLENENLLNLIINSLALYHIRYIIFSKINNKIICNIILRIFKYNSFYKSFGRNKTILGNHKSSIFSLALLDNDHIITGSRDKTLKVWNVTNLQCVKTIEESFPIRSVISLPNNTFAYCYHSYIKIINPSENFNVVKTIELGKYVGWDNLLLLNNNKLACSVKYNYDFAVIIIDEERCIELPDTDYVTSSMVNLSGNKFATAGATGSIQIWNTDDYKCEARLDEYIYSLLYINKRDILLAGSNGVFKVWDIASYNCIETVKLSYSDYIRELILLPGDYFACVMGYIGIEIWDLSSFRCVKKVIKSEGVGVNSLLLLKDNRIVSLLNNKILLNC
jgi:WD40 repeat protein